MAFVMISVAYGIKYILYINPFPIEPYYILLVFAIGFVLFSVYFEKERGAVYPWSLMGGAIASAILSFIITAAFGGMMYLLKMGFTALGTDTLVYAISICIILSMILLNLARNKL
jgi:hypothetical protein